MKDLIRILMTVMVLLTLTAVYGQPGTPPATPIDGGLGLLLAGGAAYGMKKVLDSSRKK